MRSWRVGPSVLASRPSVRTQVSDSRVMRSIGRKPIRIAASEEPTASSPEITTAEATGRSGKVGDAIRGIVEVNAAEGTPT